MNSIIYKLRYYQKHSSENTVYLFESMLGQKYSSSPRAIYEAMLKDKRFDQAQFVWSFTDTKMVETLPDNLQHKLSTSAVVKRNSRDYYKALAQANYIIIDSLFQEGLQLNPSQVLLQTWHSKPLRKFGCDTWHPPTKPAKSFAEEMQQFNYNGQITSYWLCNSAFSAQCYASAFNIKHPHNRFLQLGFPANDWLVRTVAVPHAHDLARIRIRNSLAIDLSSPTILFTPEQQTTDTSKENADENIKTLAELSSLLPPDYTILYREQYIESASKNDLPYNVIDVSNYHDASELYLASDLLLTSLSSIIFDYALTKQPIVFYQPNQLTISKTEQDFYTDLARLPGPECTTLAECAKQIKTIIADRNSYEQEYRFISDYLTEKYIQLDDGNASQRLLDYICQRNTPKVKAKTETKAKPAATTEPLNQDLIELLS